MKCPKCDYLGFESGERCRNCGYDFSLSPAASEPELSLRTQASSVGPLDDLSLVDAAAVFAPTPPARAGRGGDGAEIRAAGGMGAPTPELPLFGSETAGDVPLITTPSAPRPPLAVRRATDPPRVRAEPPRVQQLDLSSAEFEIAAERPLQPADRTNPGTFVPPEAPGIVAAGMAARVTAAAIDLILLAAIDVVVVYFTLQICGLTPAELDMLPVGPLVGFLVLQNGGYLVVFTAGGQTLGKMAAGIRVVAAEAGQHLDMGRSLVRTVVWAALAVPAGLGFLSAVFNRDHRGLHDRCAGTRVVRATA